MVKFRDRAEETKMREGDGGCDEALDSGEVVGTSLKTQMAGEESTLGCLLVASFQDERSHCVDDSDEWQQALVNLGSNLEQVMSSLCERLPAPDAAMCV